MRSGDSARLRVRVDDAERLAALDLYAIVDTAPEWEYELLVDAMRRVCGMPMAAVAFVDRERMWMKAERGFASPVLPREVCFCSVCIHSNEPTIVTDAFEDVRFRENELVTGDVHLRFYAGFPLFSREGFGLGTVCLVDTEPRKLDGGRMTWLLQARDWVSAKLELRRSLASWKAEGSEEAPESAIRRLHAERKVMQAWEAVEQGMRKLDH